MGLDAGLRRHDGAPQALCCAYHPLTCIFEGGTKDTKVSEQSYSELRALHAFVVKPLSHLFTSFQANKLPLELQVFPREFARFG